MVLPDGEHVEAELVGQLGFLHEVPDPLFRADDDAGGGIGRYFDETAESKFHAMYYSTSHREVEANPSIRMRPCRH